MKQVLAIARLAVKAALRSRVLATIAVILLVVVIGLPLSIKGDGTLRGQIVLLLYYALGLTTIILGLSTIWISCWSIAREVEAKRIQMVVVKPVHRFQIWLGKWLGILFMNAILLVSSAIITLAAVELKMASSDEGAAQKAIVREEVLSCRIRLRPDSEDINTEAHELMEVLAERKMLPEDASHEEAFDLARKRILASRATVSPGSSKQWTINLGRAAGDSEITLRYNLSRHARDRNPVSGQWIVGTDQNSAVYTNTIDNYLFGDHTLSIPRGILQNAEKMIVTFVNSDRDVSNVAVFDRDEDLELLIEKGGFGGNYLRCLIILFCNIAILAAVGLTASSLFTFPVASFTVISLLVISLLAHYFDATYGTDTGHHHHGHSCDAQEKSSVMAVAEQIVLKMHIVVAPAMKYQPIDPLTDGIRISWKETAEALFVLLILYPALFGFVSGWLLNRRELAI